MLDWLGQNSQVANVLINAGMLLVWMFYAQLLLSSYRRQRRPQVLINQTKGYDMDSEIMVSNMSEQSVFIRSVMAMVETGEERLFRQITDVTVDDEDEPGQIRRVTSQGPLPGGGSMRLGTFRRLTRWINSEHDSIDGWSVIEIRLVFRYGSEDHPIGVWRRFRLEDGEDGESGCRIRPETIITQRLSGWRGRRQVRRWMADCSEGPARGSRGAYS